MTLPHDETRARLIRVTLDLMDHGGLEAVKARPIANRVGVSVGTVYNLFGSIDGLVQEANAHVLEDFATYALASIREADAARDIIIAEGRMDPVAALQDRLLTMASAYVDYVEANESRWGAMLSYNRNRAVGIISDNYSTLQDSLFGWIADTLKPTRFGADPDTRFTAARMLWSAVHGIVLLNYLGQASDETRSHTWRQIEMLVSSFVRGAV